MEGMRYSESTKTIWSLVEPFDVQSIAGLEGIEAYGSMLADYAVNSTSAQELSPFAEKSQLLCDE